ncbi:TonB-dependent receptor plug domain-containing protein [Solimonas soli]|uniref:TonB-dependent receptor plug domain-containing protein n=1 Tax=Solimonas soli TaxID=413479 RepID=UPI0005B85747|nr:TonB-dependent receptor [Solimonas soli]
MNVNGIGAVLESMRPRVPARAWACASLVLGAALAVQNAHAQSTDAAATEVAVADPDPAPAPEPAADDSVEEVIVTGTRKVGMQASDSPAPVQVIGVETLKQSGATDLVNAIATMVPSFNAEQTGGDMESQTLTARLRGLSPNHALVLVNGKRRHITANVAVGGGAVTGAEVADLAFIPSDAIDHIEVLTDGAAAQYGSDAIAGVINIILKKGYEGGVADGGYAGYQDGGGGTSNLAGNIGFGSDKMFLNLTAEVLNQATAHREGTYGPAQCLLDGPVSEGGSCPDETYQSNLVNQNMIYAKGFPKLNPWGAPPEVHKQIGFFNAGAELGGGIDFYSFGSFGKKQAQSFENYRRPTQGGGYTNPTTGEQEYLYPFGFWPSEMSDETDYALTMGVKGAFADWNWDLSSSYGKDKMDVHTINSMNFTLYADTGASPTDFYDGTFNASQLTTNLDISHDFAIGLAAPMTVAMGVEHRHDTYGIDPGEPASYYGAGASSFPGYNPALNTGDYSRNNIAGYVDFILTPVEAWQIDLAGRFEHYSDFGSKTVGKLTTRYDISDAVAVRGTVSTGFRAPTLGEEYYSAVNVGPTSASPVLQPNGPGAASLGLGSGLKPETSTNFSFGLVLHPIPKMTTTIDAYQIEIKDRILQADLCYAENEPGGGVHDSIAMPCHGEPGGPFNVAIGTVLAEQGYIGDPANPQGPGGTLDPSARANIDVLLFNNSLSTRTRGVDLVTTYPMAFDWGSVDWTLSGNYNETKVTKVAAMPEELGGGTLYGKDTLSTYTTGSPKYRVNLGALLTMGKFSLNVQESWYGSSYTWAHTSYTDLYGANGIDADGWYKDKIGGMPITNVEFAFKPVKTLKFSVGADNLFNNYPNKVKGEVYQKYVDGYSTSTATVYKSGSPVGFFGARYFGKVSYSF